jgi:hypothetical protein
MTNTSSPETTGKQSEVSLSRRSLLAAGNICLFLAALVLISPLRTLSGERASWCVLFPCFLVYLVDVDWLLR